jgi:hypothetical protein
MVAPQRAARREPHANDVRRDGRNEDNSLLIPERDRVADASRLRHVAQ